MTPSPSAADEHPLEFPKFVGELRFDNQSVRVSGSIQVRKDGAVAYKLDDIPIDKDTAWLFKATETKGRIIRPFQFAGSDQYGTQLSSELFYIYSQRTSSDENGRRFNFGGEILDLCIDYRPQPTTCQNLSVHYFQTGMKCWGRPTGTTPEGQVILSGPSNLNDPDDLNGMLTIQAPDQPSEQAQWLGRCDALVSRVLDLLSFAQGRHFRWSARRLEDNKGPISILCRGPRPASFHQGAVFSHLNLQPVLDLALSRYTQELCDETGLGLAIEWFVNNPNYRELQLLSAITALEAIVDLYTNEHGMPLLVDPLILAPLIQEVQEAWKQQLDISEEIRSQKDPKELARLKNETERRNRVIEKLAHVNEGSFRDELRKFIDEQKIPIGDFGWKRLSDAIAARNSVLHSGRYSPRDSKRTPLHEHIAILREFLVRIIFHFLGFEGGYWSGLTATWTSYPTPKP